MVELIERGDPAVMFCHWAGLYSHGKKTGLEACKKVITTINGKYRDRTIWMKTSEMARYQSAKELTKIEKRGREIVLTRHSPARALRWRLPRRATFRLCRTQGCPFRWLERRQATPSSPA